MFALCLAKWLNILVPFALKRAVDALEAQQQTLGASGAAVVMSVGGPLLGAYVAARLGVSLANEARSVAFAGVLQTGAHLTPTAPLAPQPVPLNPTPNPHQACCRPRLDASRSTCSMRCTGGTRPSTSPTPPARSRPRLLARCACARPGWMPPPPDGPRRPHPLPRRLLPHVSPPVLGRCGASSRCSSSPSACSQGHRPSWQRQI